MGTASGIETVEDFARGDTGEGRDAEELLATIASDQLGWDEAAINADSAGLDKCPKGYEGVYYAAYEQAARRRVVELARDAD